MREIIDANTLFGFWPMRKVDMSLENLLRIMKDHSVEKALSLSARGIFHDYAQGNDETLAASREHGEIIPVATVHLGAYFGVREEIAKRVKQGFKAFRLFPEYQGYPLEYAPLQKMLTQINKFETVLMLPAKAGITSVAKVTQGFERPIIMTSSSIQKLNLAEALVVMEDNPNIHLDASLLGVGGISIVAEEAGAERIVYGSNSPLSYISSSLMAVEHAKITDQAKRLILRENIQKLLGVK